MNYLSRFVDHYLPQVRDFLAKSLRDVDIIVPIENKGVRLFEETVRSLPTPLRGTVYVPNAIPYISPSELDGKIVGIIDDSTIYGRNLRRVTSLFKSDKTQVRCFAFAACNEPDVVARRRATGLRIDSALSLKKRDYDNFVRSLGTFLRTRGHSLPVDNTKFTLHYPQANGTIAWRLVLDQLANLGTVTESWTDAADGRYFKASLHFPIGFSAGSLSKAIIDDGIIKLRLFMREASGVITCNPMVFTSLKDPTNCWEKLDQPASPLLLDLKRAFTKSAVTADAETAAIIRHDQFGFYLDCEFFGFILQILNGSDAKPDHVRHDGAEMMRYYGPSTGAALVVALDRFLSSQFRPLATIPLYALDDIAEPRQGLFAIGKMESALKLLRKSYDQQAKTQRDPLKWRHRGTTFEQLVHKLQISKLEGSIFVDTLCDSGHLVPFNKWNTKANVVSRLYRAAEDPGDERGQAIAYVISRLMEVERFKSVKAVSKTATEKVMLLLKHYLPPSELDPDIRVVRGKFGGQVRLKGTERCAEPQWYSLDAYPTGWYCAVDGTSEVGYRPTEAFDKALSDQSLRGASEHADGYLDRIIDLLDNERGLEPLILMSLLAGREFGLTYVTADIEMGLKPFRESATRGSNDTKLHSKGYEFIAIASDKLRMLKDEKLLSALGRRFKGNSLTDRALKANLVALKSDSFQIRMAGAATDFVLSLLQALTQAEPHVQLLLDEKPKPRRAPPEAAALLNTLTTVLRLGEPTNSHIANESQAKILLSAEVLNIFYAVSNVRCDYKSSLTTTPQQRYFLVADLTNFTRIGSKTEHLRFADLADEAMNIIYGYAILFGATIAKPSEGDKAMLGFPTRGQALAAAACCFEHFRSLGSAMSGAEHFGIKCGLAAGESSLIVGGDIVSEALNVASRLCSAARSQGSDGGILGTTQMVGDVYLSGAKHKIDITSGDATVKVVEVVEVNSAKIVDELIDAIGRLGASI